MRLDLESAQWHGADDCDARFTKKINELAKDESDILLEYLHHHIAENHDLQVRFRWEQGSFGECAVDVVKETDMRSDLG